MVAAAGEGHRAHTGEAEHRHRAVPLRAGAVAELPLVVLAPAPRGAVGAQRAGVVVGGGDDADVRKALHCNG